MYKDTVPYTPRPKPHSLVKDTISRFLYVKTTLTASFRLTFSCVKGTRSLLLVKKIITKRIRPRAHTAVEITRSRPWPSAFLYCCLPIKAFITRPTTITTTIPPDWPTLRRNEAMEMAVERSAGLGEHREPKQLDGLSTAQLKAVYKE